MKKKKKPKLDSVTKFTFSSQLFKKKFNFNKIKVFKLSAGLSPVESGKESKPAAAAIFMGWLVASDQVWKSKRW